MYMYVCIRIYVYVCIQYYLTYVRVLLSCIAIDSLHDKIEGFLLRLVYYCGYQVPKKIFQQIVKHDENRRKCN